MNREDKWIRSWKEQLEDYQMPAPENLWAELEQELQRPKVIPFYRRYGAVAAVVSVLLLASAAVWWMQSSSMGYVQDVSKKIADVPAGSTTDMLQKNEPVKMAEAREKPLMMAKAMPARKERKIIPTETNMADGVVYTSEIPAEDKEKEISAVAESETEQAGQTRSAGKQRTRSFTYNFDSDKPSAHKFKDNENKWAIGVSVGNAPMNAQKQKEGYGSLGGKRSFMPLMASQNGSPVANAYSQIYASNLNNIVRSKTKHKMPVTFAISVRMNLNEHWALESGLTYTKLSSELWSGAESDYYKSDQKLHYVGIPVKASYKIWANKRFVFYVSAGGAVEKCVSGKVNTACVVNNEVKSMEKEDLKVKELQWSLTSAVGAQVNLTPHLGLYVEPGLNYYIKDGSGVSTIRKEHPLNFNLQTGLRFTY